MQVNKTILATLGNGAKKTAKEIIKETGIRNGLVMDALDKMEDVGTIRSDLEDGAIVYFLPCGAVAPADAPMPPVSTSDELPEWDVSEARGYVLSIEDAFTPASVIHRFGKQHSVNIYALLKQMEKQQIIAKSARGMYHRVSQVHPEQVLPTSMQGVADSILSSLSMNRADDEMRDAEDSASSQAIVLAPPECMKPVATENNTPLFGIFSDGSCSVSLGTHDIAFEQEQIAALLAFFSAAFGYQKVGV